MRSIALLVYLSVPVRPVWPSQPARCFVLAGSASARYLRHWRYSQ